MPQQTNSKRLTNLWLIYFFRYMLLIPIVFAVGFIVYTYFDVGLNKDSYTVIGNNVRIIGLSLLAMAVTFGLGRLERRHSVHFPRELLVAIMLFVVAALVVGDAYGQYDRFWWWDDMLHSLSGIIMALVGFLLVYFFNARYNMRLSPVFVAMFAFTFAITMGVMWEIVEFAIDYCFPSNMQGWIQSDGAVLIGRDYQGYGLRDTMSDLILACLWAFVTSAGAYFSYKNSRKKVLNVMRRTFPGVAQQKKRTV